MKTIKITYSLNGKAYKHTAILSNDLCELSTNKRNKCVDTFDIDEDSWSMVFGICKDDELAEIHEVEFFREDGERTLTPVWAMAWHDSGPILGETAKVNVATR